MLTQKQLDKLEPLTLHPKFGKLLIDAIETWKTVKPIRLKLGLSQNRSLYIHDERCDGCCLIGAAMIGKSVTPGIGIYLDCHLKFGLSVNEIGDLQSGFDRKSKVIEIDNEDEALKFGNLIGRIMIN